MWYDGENGLSSASSASLYHFYPFLPDRIPVTHRYRRIPTTEFCRLLIEKVEANAGYSVSHHPLEYGKKSKRVFVDFDGTGFVLLILTCGKVRGYHKCLRYGEEYALPPLRSSDFVVVLESAKIGWFMGWPGVREKDEVSRRVIAGLIEPKNVLL